MNIFEYITELHIRDDRVMRETRRIVWDNYVRNAKMEVINYVEEKGLDFEWEGVWINWEKRKKARLHFSPTRSRFFREVVKPGIQEIVEKWQGRVEFQVHQYKKAKEVFGVVNLEWLATEIDAEVLRGNVFKYITEPFHTDV